MLKGEYQLRGRVKGFDRREVSSGFDFRGDVSEAGYRELKWWHATASARRGNITLDKRAKNERKKKK